jgi:DNA-binding PadR family transcriptional regulator
MPKTSEPESSGTLREPTYFILLTLASYNRQNAPAKHGYAILKDVESLSQGRVRLSTSTLYEALARLLEQGWIERVDDELESAAAAGALRPGKPRKAYRLAPLGRRVLEAEVSRLEGLMAAARRQLASGSTERG